MSDHQTPAYSALECLAYHQFCSVLPDGKELLFTRYTRCMTNQMHKHLPSSVTRYLEIKKYVRQKFVNFNMFNFSGRENVHEEPDGSSRQAKGPAVPLPG